MYILNTLPIEKQFQWYSLYQCVEDNKKKYLINCIGYTNYYIPTEEQIIYNLELQIPLIQYAVEDKCVIVSDQLINNTIMRNLKINKKVYVLNDLYIINKEEDFVVEEDNPEESLIDLKIKKLKFISLLMKSRFYHPLFKTFNTDLFVLQKLILENKIKINESLENTTVTDSLKKLYTDYDATIYNDFITMLENLGNTELFYLFTLDDVDVSSLTDEEKDIVSRFLISSHYLTECITDYYNSFSAIQNATTLEELDEAEKEFLRIYYSAFLAQN